MSTWEGSPPALADVLERESVALYDDAPCGYVSMLPDGTIIQVNRTFCEWLGYASEALLSRRLQTLLTIGAQIYWETHFAPLLAMQGYISEIALDLKDRGGNVLPVLVSARQRRDAAGGVLFVRTVIFNATERRRYERELLHERTRADEQAKAKAELLRMLSHDIRTPLSTIVNIAHVQTGRAPSEADQKQMQVLRRAAESILSLVNQVLDAERLEATRVELRPEVIDVRRLVTAVVEESCVVGAPKGLTITWSVGASVPSGVLADEVRLRQVLMNLVANAVKFTTHGSVTVVVEERLRRHDRTQVMFDVRDTGIGIAPDRLEAIFEPFVQATADTTRQYGGSGLGLTICRRILDAFDSRLEVSSTVGKGSSFRFELDLAIDPTLVPSDQSVAGRQSAP